MENVQLDKDITLEDSGPVDVVTMYNNILNNAATIAKDHGDEMMIEFYTTTIKGLLVQLNRCCANLERYEELISRLNAAVDRQRNTPPTTMEC